MPEHIFKGDSGNWYAECRHKNVRIRGILRDAEGNPTQDRRLAERILAKHKMEVDEGRYLAWKRIFSDLVEEYKKKVLPRKTKCSQERTDYIIRLHILPWFGKMRVSEIDEFAVYQYFQRNRKKPQSTLKKELRVLREIVQLANQKFTLPSLKFENKGRRFDETQILDSDDIRAMLRHILPKYRDICLIASYSGLRLKDVVGIKRRNVNLKTGWIELRQSKTGKPASIPICGKLADVFRAIPVLPIDPDAEYFPNVSTNAVSISTRRAFKKIGLTWAGFHSLRHYAACELINNGVPLEVIQRFMGHDDFRSTLIYARVKRETLKEAVKVFDQERG